MSENISAPESRERLSARVAELEVKLAEAEKVAGWVKAERDGEKKRAEGLFNTNCTLRQRITELEQEVHEWEESDAADIVLGPILGEDAVRAETAEAVCRTREWQVTNLTEKLANAEARAVAAEAALREARKFTSDLADKYYFDYKRGDKRGDSYSEGKSDAADEIAQKLAALAPQAPADRREQSISFAYGNVSIGNPAVTREMVAAEYDKLHPALEKCSKCQGTGLCGFGMPGFGPCPACLGGKQHG